MNEQKKLMLALLKLDEASRTPPTDPKFQDCVCKAIQMFQEFAETLNHFPVGNCCMKKFIQEAAFYLAE